MADVPTIRVEALNDQPVRRDGRFVLYWMIATRRPHANYALTHAADLARLHDVGLVVLEALRCDYTWASDRLHRFVIQGMQDNAVALSPDCVYYPYVEPTRGAGKGLFAALAREAVAVVTDEFPCFFLPAMTRAAAAKINVRLQHVDSNGLLPLRAAEREFTVAHSFRRWLQKNLREHLMHRPVEAQLADLPRCTVNPEIEQRWPRANLDALAADLSSLPIDHDVPPAPDDGGWKHAHARLRVWVRDGLPRYADGRNDPDTDAASGLSPWLHFGHIGAWEILDGLAEREGWTPDAMATNADGKRGWWGMSPEGEAFIDELVTWRELGYEWCHKHPDDYDAYDSLPAFALQTLSEHAHDKRQYLYTAEEFEQARTHDELWNAAQRQLVHEGRIHNYLRMLWGKCILAWSATPQQALETMIHLNNKYALDGRNPNSYSGIFWCLGRFDRAWGPERPVFGKVRYMTTQSARRKLRLDGYLRKWAP